MKLNNEVLYFDNSNFQWCQKGAFYFSISEKYFTWIKTGNVGYEILQKLDGEKTLEQVARELAVEYEIPIEDIQKDVLSFCEDCQDNGLLFKKGSSCKETRFDQRLSRLFLDITDKCNLNCKYCNKMTVQKESEGAYLTAETINEYLKFIFKERNGAETLVYVTGGEPLLHPDLKGVFEAIHSFGCRIVLWTNGILLDESKTNLLKKYCDYVIISLDHSEEDKNDAIRGNGSFKGAVDAAKTCKETSIPFFIASTPAKYNFRELDKLFTFTFNLGANGLLLNEPILMKTNHEDLSQYFEYSLSELKNIEQRIAKRTNIINSWKNNVRKYKDKNKPNIVFLRDSQKCINSLFSVKPKMNCGAGTNEICVDLKGNVYPCHALQLDEYKMGTVRTYADSDVSPVKFNELQGCEQCSYRIFCLGGCRAAALYHNNDLKGKYPSCEYEKANYDEIIWSPLQPVGRKSEKNHG